MESSACRRGASDADLSPRAYSATAECEPVMVKEEPDCGVCGVSEAALAEGLYAGHEVKGEIVIGPELIEQQDIAFSMQSTLRKAEEDACEVKPAGEAGPATESTRAQQKRSTSLAVCELIKIVIQCRNYNDKLPSLGIFMDMSKAFDRVCQEKLLHKLNIRHMQLFSVAKIASSRKTALH
ncbi:hypothetical protein MSG28_014772 [Choristoneura fumiferana]|uniref:Uncharacterized protein n=1 Tax=Choristoneura fumiferana TaxID=7141 RepID=A0ACC0JT05_CHOFU|nr:hypothetical protein MSG28_014772 [Choristoneura fumiferana]